MSKITPEIESMMKKQGVYALATASKGGVPNVVPVGMMFLGEDGKVWLVDNYLKKTLRNIQENPLVSFYVWNPESKESYQLKGNAAVFNSGADYEKAVAFAHSKKETFPAKNLVKIEVTEVYYTTPGSHAGDLVQ